jgi:serine/threonine protein kinase
MELFLDVFQKGRTLGRGSFGEVFDATDTRTGAAVAVKIERRDAPHPQLAYEHAVMKGLALGAGIPRVHVFGTQDEYNVLVMERLGSSVEAVRAASPGRVLPMSVVRHFARGALAALHTVHAAAFVHRDVKPDNFVFGTDAAGHTRKAVFLIDYGLCKRLLDADGRHIPHATGLGFVGSAKFASVRAHAGEQQSRRDDVEALGYTLVYLALGTLPWQGMGDAVPSVKAATTIEDLCRGLPPSFAETVTYGRELPFDAMPDYAYLRALWDK